MEPHSLRRKRRAGSRASRRQLLRWSGRPRSLHRVRTPRITGTRTPPTASCTQRFDRSTAAPDRPGSDSASAEAVELALARLARLLAEDDHAQNVIGLD